MPNTIKLKNSGTASNVPSSLEFGELGLNYADGKLYYKNASNTIVQFSAPVTGASSYVAQGRLTGDQSIPSMTDTLISFVDDFDPNNWWDATSKRFTPTIAGYYNISVGVWWVAGASTANQYNTQVRKNGNTFAIFQNQITTSNGLSQGGSKLVYLNGSTDYVDITVYNGDSTSRSIQWGGNSNGQGTWFSASLVTVGKGDKGDTGATGPAGSTTLDGLSDAIITSPEEFQSLSYDGTNWVNGHIPVVSYVRNAESTTLTTGTCVYLFGATGDHASVKRADNGSDITSSKTIGVVGANITASNNGPVITRGYVDGIDLSTGYTAGDILWLGTNGAFTKTKTTSPNHLVFIGVVIRATSNGIIYVATQNGYELDELHNVSAGSPSAGDFLKYNGSLWINDAIDLGTDTTGSYVASLVAGTGVTLSNNSGEGSTPTISIGQAVATNSNVTFNDITISGNLTVNGTTSTINSTILTVDDINIELGSVATPSNTTATGGGITLKGATDKTITWNSVGWTSSEDFNLVSGKSYEIDGNTVISSSGLGSSVVSSNLTSVGTLTSLTVSGNVSVTGSVVDHSSISQQSSSFTLAIGDDGKTIESNVSSPNTLVISIPTDASVNFPIGTSIDIIQTGNGKTQIAAVTPANTTVNSASGFYLRTQWSTATLFKRAVNNWVLFGDTSTT